MSTIERAAERLAKAEGGKKNAIEETQPLGPQTGHGSAESAASDPVVLADKTVVEPDATAEAKPGSSALYVGGGYHEIDLEALQTNGFITAEDGRSRLALDFRRIKRPLLLNSRRVGADEHPGNLIAVTSSVPGEGKTFVSINLAMSIAAEVDLNVLLVDGDAARGSVSEVLGLQYDKGLSDVLARGGRHLQDTIFKTNVDHLSILPSGSNLPNTDELFASELMGRVVRGLAEEDPQRIVIFDSPPLLAGTEAAGLARLVGQVVVVVEANSTPQATVSEALRLLRTRDRVSLVLNKVPRRESDGAGYGYGYGYG